MHDPGAPSDARWRLVWHRYLHIDDGDSSTDDRHIEHGWLAQRKAATAEGLMTAPETKLFSALAYHAPSTEAYNEAAPGGSPEKSFAGDPDLGDCLALAEPGLIAEGGSLYIAMFCYREETQQDIVLAKLDHATSSWSYVSTLLTTQDAVGDQSSAHWVQWGGLGGILRGAQPHCLAHRRRLPRVLDVRHRPQCRHGVRSNACCSQERGYRRVPDRSLHTMTMMR